MKNLKRALSFALASVMLVGMMVVGAGAASFNDAEDIQHTEAVNSMVALGLIGGRPNGDFDPTATITRAEMAKLVCVAMNGGRDPQLDGECQFEDVKAVNHWASGYIQYCVNMGYANGRSATVFDPDAPITAQEAAKMMLNAIGYNTEFEGFTGAGWGNRVDSVANNKALYKDVMLLTTNKLSRDDAAQIVWNALDANMVKYDYLITTVNGQIQTKAVAEDKVPTIDILRERFDIQNDEGYLTKVTYNSAKKEYNYTVTVARATSATATDLVISSTQDFTGLYGDKVKVLWKPQSNGSNEKTLYGIYSISGDVITTLKGDISGTDSGAAESFKTGGVKYTLGQTYNSTVAYIGTDTTNAANQTTLGALSATNAATFKFIDENSDGDYDYAVATLTTVGKVTYVGTSTATVGGASYDLKDDVSEYYNGMAKDDFAVITPDPFTDTVSIAKADVITGKITAVKDTSTVQVDGEWYKKDTSCSALGAANIGSTYKLAVVGGYYYNAAITNEAGVSDDVLYISAADEVESTLGTNTIKAKAWFTDGSSKVITVSKIEDTKLTGTDANDRAALADDTLPNYTGNYTGNKLAVGAMYRYSKNSDGNYTLYYLAATNDVTKAGYKYYEQNNSGSTGFDASEDKIAVQGGSNFTIADDAVIFVQTSKAGKRDVKVVSGKAIKTWNANVDVFGAAQVLASDVNGFKTVRVATVVSSTLTAISGTATLNYGYVTADTYLTTNSDDDKVVRVTVWTKDGEQTVDVRTIGVGGTDVSNSTALNDTTGLKKGCFIAYELDTDGNAVKARPFGLQAAVTGMTEDGKIVALSDDGTRASANDYKVDSDTIYVYINSADKKGIEGGSLQQASETAIEDLYVPNVVVANDVDVALAAGDTLKVVFVDAANNMKGSDVELDTVDAVITAASISNKTATVASGKTVTQVLTATSTVFDNVLGAQVLNTAGAVQTGGTTVTTNMVLRLVGTNGSVANLTITV